MTWRRKDFIVVTRSERTVMLARVFMEDPKVVPARNRSLYALAVVGTVSLGLASRRFPFIGKYPGDALWSLMVFFALGFAFPKAKSVSVALIAAAISCAIEFLKLNQALWLVSARASSLGHLVFGHVFSWQNLVAYGVGISVGFLFERWAGRCPASRVG